MNVNDRPDRQPLRNLSPPASKILVEQSIGKIDRRQIKIRDHHKQIDMNSFFAYAPSRFVKGPYTLRR